MHWKMINPNDLKIKQAVRNVAALLLVGVFILAGCQGQSILDAVFPDAESQLGGQGTPTPDIDLESEGTVTPDSLADIDLVVWVLPQFDPNGESDASLLLNERFREFLVRNPQVNLTIRVKAVSGPGSMLDSLTGASSVARDALPSLVLLNRTDLVTAANRGLVFPIEEISTSVDETDWYPFAQSMAIHQGSVFGLPFASNTLGLLVRSNDLPDDQPSWDEALRRLDSLIFPAGDADALVTLALYLSAGGSLDAQMGHIGINLDALTAALDVYERARRAGVVKRDVLEYQTDDQAWDAFRVGDADAVITWAHRLFTEEEDLGLALLPPLGENPMTLGTGWSWCLTEPEEQKRKFAAALAEFLSAPEFLSRWAPLSGFLPVRPSSLDGFSQEGLQSTLSTMLLSARLRPDRQAMTEIGAQIETAVIEVINTSMSAEVSAQNVINRLEESENP
jgi:ABC-type glycerol-3-phosphate transport system substrate-binding protein